MAFKLKEKVSGFAQVRSGGLKNVVVLERGGKQECWGSLTGACKAHGLPYHSLKGLKFPFEYKGIRFTKVPYNTVML